MMVCVSAPAVRSGVPLPFQQNRISCGLLESAALVTTNVDRAAIGTVG
jgi:hypothetical protein